MVFVDFAIRDLNFNNSRSHNLKDMYVYIVCIYFSPIQYGYHVSRIPFADYRVNELTPIFTGMKENSLEPKYRVLRKRYGIKIEFHQAGMLGLYIITLFLLGAGRKYTKHCFLSCI
jgi:hypothetical protein